jgi:hypothetical protein
MWAVAVVLSALLGMSAAWAQDDDGPMTNMHFLVVRDYNGKPVKNAAVVLHPVTRKGKQARGGLELKTDTDGRTSIEGIPYGPLRIQVLAPGFQTFGEDYQISKPETEIVIKMKRPGRQYSVYEDHPEDKKPEEKKTADSPPPTKNPDDTKADQKPQ